MKTPVVIDIETSGLSPLEKRITCIGVKTKTEEIVFMDEDESKMLNEFWGWASGLTNPSFIGFCSYRFDFRFIHLRSMLHEISVPFPLKNSYVDLQYELAFYNQAQKGKLNDYCSFIGVGEKNGNGAKAVVLWNEKRYEELKEYCKQDIILTWKLFERCLQAKVFDINCNLYGAI